MEKRNLTPMYSLMMCCYWMGFSVIMGFASVFLLESGFHNQQVGTLIALAGTLSAVVQPLVAAYADRPNSIGVKNIVLIIVGVMTAAAFGVFLTMGTKAPVALLYGLCLAGIQLLMPMLNAWGIGCVNDGGRLNIGMSRGISSIGYAAASFGMGSLVVLGGTMVIPLSAAAFLALLLMTGVAFPMYRPKAGSTGQQAGMLSFFKKYPRYTGILSGCVLLFISHTFLNSFTFQITISKGGSSGEMGTAMALAALIELPTLMGFSYLLKIRSPRIWFRLAGFFFTLKSLATLLAPNVLGFYAAQLFQLPGWALISVASIFYINELMQPEDAVKGQAFYTMAYTAGTVAGALIGGWLLDTVGVTAMLAFGTVSGAVGTGIVLYFTKRNDK